ncbi:hypothetical protein ASG22_19515 [Chryseobacterium sp. Leaf405]|uniref:hypothetical protein n=1 Tax=Chryseobacterium sp. Leaf405 TaxID=1736367 RepID=UPI0006FE3893|nr:hypothetical protein [Chryseobacterium sp. Leaf405]KQT30885.1 hypothetical protein ASG22_19515 [Chryseobacterium sp. Leaf405]
MRKQIITSLIILVSLNLSCTPQQKTEKPENNLNNFQKKHKIDKIELKEQTRGTNRIITFNPGSISTSLNENITKSELLSSDWENIVKQVNLIDLSKISTYKAPTTGRYSDRALASTIIITSDGKTYQSSSFDAGIPPKELEGLYNLLQSKTGGMKKSKPKFR